jgi:hypothetical protein
MKSIEKPTTSDELMELVRSGYFSLSRKRQPRPMSLGVSTRLLQAAQANPDSVRVAARDCDGVSILERPAFLTVA